MAGLNPNSEGINWGGLRYVVSMDMNNIASGLNNTSMIEDDADENGVSARCEQLYSFFVSLTSRFCTNNDLYYTVGRNQSVWLYILSIYTASTLPLRKKLCQRAGGVQRS